MRILLHSLEFISYFLSEVMLFRYFLCLIYLFSIQNVKVQCDDPFKSMLSFRFKCFNEEQKDCNEEFTDVYKELSRSVRNDTKADTYFYLFTRRNLDEPELLHKCGGKLPKSSNFDPNKTFIIVLPGFLVSVCDTAFAREYKNEFLKKGDYNVLLIDYSWADQIDYSSALANIQLIAKQIVTVLQNIQDQTGITYDKFYIVGHSFGSQLAGLIGGSFKVHRITALDPARPGFPESLPLSERLDSSDAEIVEVWHCNAGACLPNFGLDYEAGHVNFYINGGSIQTPCYNYAMQSLLKGDLKIAFSTLLIPTTCFHDQCLDYYKVSINPEHCQFVGVRCNSYEDFVDGKCKSCGRSGEKCAIMGFDFEAFSPEQALRHKKKLKKYYVETDNICPYCKNNTVDLDGFKNLYESSFASSNKE